MKNTHRCLITGFLLICALQTTASAQVSPQPEEIDYVLTSVENMFAGSEIQEIRHIELISVESRRLVDDIYEFTFAFKVGEGEFDKIGIHWVTKKFWHKHKPLRKKKKDALMMVPGASLDFRTNFLMSSQTQIAQDIPPNHSLAVYLAERNYDVWGIDFRYSFVPDNITIDGTDVPYCYATGCEFMQEWDMPMYIDDLRKAVIFARIVRSFVYGDHDKIYMLGHSDGAAFTYAYAGEYGNMHLKGIIPMDVAYKFDPAEEELIDNACHEYKITKKMIRKGIFYDDEAAVFKYIAVLAFQDPDVESEIIKGMTNKQALLLSLTATYMLDAYAPCYHIFTGNLSGLYYTDYNYTLDTIFSMDSFNSLNQILEIYGIWCSDDISEYDDHIADINVPVLYVGAEGGFGVYGVYTTQLIEESGNDDVSSCIVPDYGHADLTYAYGADDTAWSTIYDWLEEHNT